MGSGSYSTFNRSVRAESEGYHTRTIQETFSQRSMHVSMNPDDIQVRESRDSDEHPNSVPIIIALDVTGSMGMIPGHLVKDGLPNLVSSVIEGGVPDPQILFLGIGDHECDRAPLQVGQFESNDEALDGWLTNTYLEGGGGGNGAESYLLAWYFAGGRTEHDAKDKRGKKGYLFTIGDEPNLKRIPKNVLKDMFGNGQFSDVTDQEALSKAREKYHVYHIHTKETWSGSNESTIGEWQQMLGDNLIIVQSHTLIPEVISKIIKQGENIVVSKTVKSPIEESMDIENDEEVTQSEEML